MSEKDYLVTKSEDELHTWFCDNARFMPRANGSGKYFIRLGAKIYKDDDTLCLFNIVKGVLAEHKRNLTQRAPDLKRAVRKSKQLSKSAVSSG